MSFSLEFWSCANLFQPWILILHRNLKHLARSTWLLSTTIELPIKMCFRYPGVFYSNSMAKPVKPDLDYHGLNGCYFTFVKNSGIRDLFPLTIVTNRSETVYSKSVPIQKLMSPRTSSLSFCGIEQMII